MSGQDATSINGACIEVLGAFEHNLQNLDVSIERQSITVITGVSGSGKSSLAFDTILAEAQRRFFYTLSHYSRQFLDLQSRPKVRSVRGLAPAIYLEQNETQASRRATVATTTDLGELFGVLFARFAERHCPQHHLPTEAKSLAAMTSEIAANAEGQTIAVAASIAEGKQGSFKKQLNAAVRKGFQRAIIDGQTRSLTPLPELERNEKHSIKLIIDIVKVKPASRERLARSLSTALEEGGGYAAYFAVDQDGQVEAHSGRVLALAGGCPVCSYAWSRLDSRHFSVNSLGRCPSCSGLGEQTAGPKGARDDSDLAADIVEDTDRDTQSWLTAACADCSGTGLLPELRGLLFGGKNPLDIHNMSLEQVLAFIEAWRRAPLLQPSIAPKEGGGQHTPNPAMLRVLDEIATVLRRLSAVGLGYLTLARRLRTLSGGEAQRLRLANILAGSLRGIIYVLDEPSQGLSASELQALLVAFKQLKAQGSTVLIVDHDALLMRHADWIIDLGPGGGARGGRLVAKFRPHEAERYRNQSLTAKFLAESTAGQALSVRALASGATSGGAMAPSSIVLQDLGRHNLRIAKVAFAREALTVVSGVSGAGKTSLVLGSLYPRLMHSLGQTPWPKGAESPVLDGAAGITSVTVMDRSKLAKSSVSMPASYLDVLTELRDLYAAQAEAQIAGLTARDFSLSVEGGRCPECKGRGEINMSMRFLADARVTCAVCRGRRFRPAVLNVRYQGLSLAETLDLTLDEVAARYRHHRRMEQRLAPALALGLGYLKLGQPSSSLSGGEAQRLKLAPLLARRYGPGDVLILDEPTAGLHFEDVGRLLKALRTLVEKRATVVVIEHHEDFVASADQLIVVGPGAAEAGGRIIYSGPPQGYDWPGS